MSTAERAQNFELIAALDVEGMDLIERIASETGAKAAYYSEGRRKKLIKLSNGEIV